MAQRVETVLIDDLTGEPASETVRFGLDGRHYELDLTEDHAQQLRAALKAYVRQGRSVGTPKPAQQAAQEAAQVRAWARQNGYQVAARGRIHRDVIQAYRQAV